MDQIRLLIDDDVDLIDVRPMTLTRDDIVAYLKSANVAVIPNQRVSSSSTTMLASTFGVPVIAPQNGSIRDYVDSSCAFLYDADEPDALRVALSHAMQNRTDSTRWVIVRAVGLWLPIRMLSSVRSPKLYRTVASESTRR